MGLKWTLVFLLYLNISTNGFDLRRVGTERGYVDKQTDDDPSPKPSEVQVKPVMSQSQIDPRGAEGPSSSSKRFGDDDDDGDDDNPVEHPLPPRGPLSRIVVKELDSSGNPIQKTVDLTAKGLTSDSGEALPEPSPEPESSGGTATAGASEAKSVPVASTSEKLEQSYQGPSNAEDKLKDIHLEKMLSAEESRVEKKELMDGVLNALHHQINGNRKAYFRNAVSLMSKEELDDLHDVLVKALRPLPDDDVKVAETQEELKEAVHELVEETKKQGQGQGEGGSSEVEEQKAASLIELEHVLEEVQKVPEEVPEMEVEKEKKQVILKEDWKKEDIVGGIGQEGGGGQGQGQGPLMMKRNGGGAPNWWKVTSTTTTPKPKPSDDNDKVPEEVAPSDKKEEEVPAAGPEDKAEEKEPTTAEPEPEVVKEVVKLLDQAPDVPVTAEEKQDDKDKDNDEVGEIRMKPKEPPQEPAEDKVRVRVDPGIMKRIKDLSLISGILGKDKGQGQDPRVEQEQEQDQIAEELPEEARVKEVFADTVVQVKPGDARRVRGQDGDEEEVPASRRMSSKESQKDKDSEGDDKDEGASEPAEVARKSVVNCSAGPAGPSKQRPSRRSDDPEGPEGPEGTSTSNERGIADNLRGRRGGAGGRGWGPYGVTKNLRRNRRHSRTYYRRRPYPEQLRAQEQEQGRGGRISRDKRAIYEYEYNGE